MGTALNYLMDDIEKSVQKTTAEMKGDWKPIIFLFTDGTPTDNPNPAIERWQKHYQRKCNLVCISLGDNADTHLLGKLTENVLRLKETDEYSFKANGETLQFTEKVRVNYDGTATPVRAYYSKPTNFEMRPGTYFIDVYEEGGKLVGQTSVDLR